MRARERLLVRGCADADDKVFTHDAAAHMAVNHECESAEHSPFPGWAFFFRQDVADSLGYTFIKWHSSGPILRFLRKFKVSRSHVRMVHHSNACYACRNVGYIKLRPVRILSCFPVDNISPPAIFAPMKLALNKSPQFCKFRHQCGR